MIYKLLPFKLHYWLIIHFGKPYCGTYKLGDWIAGCDCIYTWNAYEIYQRWKDELSIALNKHCKED